MGELLVNHGVTSILALDNLPKALRTRSQAAHDVPRLFHTGARPQFNPNSSDADISQQIRNWVQSEPDMAWFPQYTDGFPAPTSLRPRRRTKRASWCSATPITRRTRCATASTFSSTSGATPKP